jgi:hypothetical protein
MAVTKNYTNPTKTDKVVSWNTIPTSAISISVPIALLGLKKLGSRITKLNYAFQPKAYKRNQLIPLPTNPSLRKIQWLKDILSTYPPIYKTSLGASAQVWTSARIHPPIFIKR